MTEILLACGVIAVGSMLLGSGIDQFISDDGGMLEILFGAGVILLGAHLFFDTPPYA